MAKKYHKIEYVIDRRKHGLAFGKEVDPGTTLVGQRGLAPDSTQAKRLLMPERTITKKCVANHIPGLREATTVVHIPATDVGGERIPQTQWNALFLQACALYGVPMWTQSSIKTTTFYFIERSMFEKLADEWDGNMGHRFAAYGGLLFSEVTDDEPLTFELDSLYGEKEDNDGVDGNCLVNKAAWGGSTYQFRGWRLNPETGMPCSFSKGIGVPMRGVENMQLNTSQIKMGKHPGTHLVLRNKALKGLQRKVWLSAEPILMLSNNRQTRRFLMRRVKKEAGELVELLTPEKRVKLLRRLGGLRFEGDGSLEEAKRAVIDMLRSNIPWCAEVERRITRFMIREITQKIVPSGGIYGWCSPLIISNEHGVAPCSWDEARCFAFRMPVTGAPAIIPLPKNPYKKGLGNVVTGEVARLASGDADGDYLTVVTDPYVVRLFRKHLNRKLVGGLKPHKDTFHSDLTAETLQDIAMDQVSNAWMVGTLTVKAWALIEKEEFGAASKFLEAANVEPMTYKHKVTLHGKPFRAYVHDLLNEHREDLKDATLTWRDLGKEAEEWETIRQMSRAMIAKPKGLVGFLWNAGVVAVNKWNRENPMKPLGLSRMQRLSFSENGRVISGAAYREMRELVTMWGSFWSDHISEDGQIYGDTSEIYEKVSKWADFASDEAKAALLAWKPKSGDGFGLKYWAVFVHGDGVKLLGYHPLVQDVVDAEKKKVEAKRLASFEDNKKKKKVVANLT